MRRLDVASSHHAEAQARLPWIEVCPGAPYFQTERGEAWQPIGHNDAISWPDLLPLFARRDLPAAERYLTNLVAHGVTVLRLMLEYAQVDHRFLERPVGTYPPRMVQLWDDLFEIAERIGLRLLITPFDTFWQWMRWRKHPYNRVNGGPLAHPSQFLLCGETRAAMKARFDFVIRRWSGSGAFFAWDLMNEIHPAQGGDSADCFPGFISDISHHVRRRERELHGRAHPQTVSLFGPELEWRAHMPLRDPIFRHPDLDFASVHIYQQGTIDHPRDTIGPAIDMGRHVRAALAEIQDGRPFLDTEHGPIHTFKDKRRTLPEAFDDEYFRHMQWAHLASGGAGGGMRWPNRKPHRLTPGMHLAQQALARMTPLIDWRAFRRRAIDVQAQGAVRLHVFACGDRRQALLYLLRGDSVRRDGTLDPHAAPIAPQLAIPGLDAGSYKLTPVDPRTGLAGSAVAGECESGVLRIQAPPFVSDQLIAIVP